jgi:hypothetical protein
VGRHTIGSDEARNGTAVPVWEILLQIAADVPDEELAKIPHDAAEQHDHYLYGAPKRASSREPAHR